jgi:hypothetical protein
MELRFKGKVLPLALAISLSGLMLPGFAQVNTLNNGSIVNGGTYLNTRDSKTTFRNTAGTGLWLKSGSNIRGIEINSGGVPTGNGGTLHFLAPGQVVRLDGNIDVNGLRNGSGAFIGNGGKVFVDSAYLFQKGNIYANGINGGLIQFNVGSLTIAPNARIEAKGFSGDGGQVLVNASGTADIQQDTNIDSSGKVTGTFDTNIINIEGGLVNLEGKLSATGIHTRGGTIRLVATGQTDLSQSRSALAKSTVFTDTEKTDVNNRLNALKATQDGDIRLSSGDGTRDNRAQIQANAISGPTVEPISNDPADPAVRAGDGGTIILMAERNINNGGLVMANGGQGDATLGGNGGTISMNSGHNINNIFRIVSDGGNSIGDTNGGNGGLLAFSYGNAMNNNGVIRSQGGHSSNCLGGHGGLVVFSGDSNLAGSGSVYTYMGLGPSGNGSLGYIVAPNPVSSSNRLYGVWRKTQPLELLSNAENVFLLRDSRATNATSGNTLNSMSLNAQVRSVRDPEGQGPRNNSGQAANEFFSKSAKYFGPDRPSTQFYFFRNLIFSNTGNEAVSLDTGRLNRGTGETYMKSKLKSLNFLSGGDVHYIGPNYSENTYYGQTGGQLSSISRNYTQDINFNSFGELSGGSVNIAAKENFAGGAALFGYVHGGSVILKAGHTLRVTFQQGVHASTNGATIQLLAGHSFENHGNISSSGIPVGGSIFIKALNRIYNGHNLWIQATGEDYGGHILLQTNGEIINNGSIVAPGNNIEDGQVVTESIY